MLSILAFKKSLFAGVLDGGPSEVLLGGSRLKRFMESVDAVTTAAAGPAPDAPPPLARMPLVARDPLMIDSAKCAVVQAQVLQTLGDALSRLVSSLAK